MQCLDALRKSPTLDPIIVVDNEADGELARAVAAAAMRATVIPLVENRGFAGGTNPGLRAALEAGADFVLVINSDATIDAPSVEKLLAYGRADPSLGAVGPRILNPDGSVQTLGVRWTLGGARLEQMLKPGSVDSLTWACVLLNARCLKEVGLLDERFFMYWEDFEFSRRATDRGWKLAVAPDAVAVHALSSSATRAGSMLESYHFWGLITLARIRPGADRWRSLIRLLTLLSKRVLRLDRAGLVAACRGIRFARFAGKGYEVLAKHSS